MNVVQILNSKGSHDVETIDAQKTLAQAVERLAKRRIGALVVVAADGKISGIVSERDIIRRLGEEGADALKTSVADAMTARVESCTPSDSAISVLERMTNGRFRHMPVMEGGQMTGLLSIGDVVKARIGEIEAENEAMAVMLSG